ncbi:hypothetical protein DPEC_G00183900 [Dallia pectoralis]|uniref:Uncharacterized protein n=1 Tax=Dallia pectoralis TaxID=75939 RepID=A0ACC2GAW8_DALPE|nr:hypothetical protein DPEC_G00183900 [Dallia pectoralis]
MKQLDPGQGKSGERGPEGGRGGRVFCGTGDGSGLGRGIGGGGGRLLSPLWKTEAFETLCVLSCARLCRAHTSFVCNPIPPGDHLGSMEKQKQGVAPACSTTGFPLLLR